MKKALNYSYLFLLISLVLLSSQSFSSEHSTSEITDPATEFTQPSDTPEEAQRKIQDLRQNEKLRQEQIYHFNHIDKPNINHVLGLLMELLELERDGITRIRTVAIHLKSLLDIHRNYVIGSREKLVALSDLSHKISDSIEYTGKQPKITYSPLDVQSTLKALKKEKFDSIILVFIRDYFQETGQISTYGFKAGAMAILGGELGLHAGKVVTSTGKRYAVMNVSGTFDRGIGAALYFGHFTGRTSSRSHTIYFDSEKPNQNCDTFFWSHSVSNEAGPGNQILLKEGNVVPGIRYSSTGATYPLKLFPLPGRDYKFLRMQLGLYP